MRAAIYDPNVFRSCISMPKLNGLRAMYVPGRGFFTRDGIQWPDETLAHITAKLNYNGWLDGELYCHGMTLQDITSAVGITRLGPGERALDVKFHVFDLLGEGNALWRREKLFNTFTPPSGCELVPSHICLNRIELDARYADYLAHGYEGQMIKAASGYYVGQGKSKRPTVNLQKRKAFLDSEFKCVDVTISDEARIKGLVGSLIFETPSGKRFGVGTGFDDSDRRKWVNNPPFGQSATIRYLYFSEDGIPQNNSFVAWRE